MEELTRLIKDDMKPALGVTEPGAIAYAVASARAHVPGRIEKVQVRLNSGMYKNAYTCGIPNSSRFGNLYAAALGAVAADAKKGLESLADITSEDDEAAAKMVEDGKVEVLLDCIDSRIMIDASVETKADICTVSIRDSHTNIVLIEKNGKKIFEAESDTAKKIPDSQATPVIHRYSLRDILDYVDHVALEELAFIRDAFVMNMELLEEGLASDRAVIAKRLLRKNQDQMFSEHVLNTAQLLCNGAIEARVLGLSRPAMSITGSGAHGIIATMPLLAEYKSRHAEKGGAERLKQEDEPLLRATALSYLITMYIKEYSGRLSAFCGCGIAAGTGMACGLAYMRGADVAVITMVLQNMASGLTGMICDGGNHGCAMKGIVAVDAAFRSAELALEGICIESIHGINGKTPEDTMKHMGMIASPGMVQTEKTIVEIMEQK